MYEKFFQFNRHPFSLTPDPQFFFFSKHHEEAFSQIIYGIQERKGFILITGEVGTGKTTLCRLLLEKLDLSVRTSLIFNPAFSTIELLQAINQDFGIGGQAFSKKVLLDELNRYLLNGVSRGENAVVMIDEAQNLSVECLEEIRMLSNLETSREKLIQIVLIGQPELKQKLGLAQLRQLNQRIALRYHLQPLDQEMTGDYIRCRLRVAGGQDKVHFTPAAIEVIQQFTQGIPRLINITCDKALLAAYVSETFVVSPGLMNSALADLIPMNPRPKFSFRSLGSRRAWSVALAGVVLFAVFSWAWFGKAWEGISQSGREATVQATALEPDPVVAAEAEGVGNAREGGKGPAQAAQESLGTATTASEGRSGSPTVGYAFDSDGVFRVDDPKGSERAAYLTLASLWQAMAPISAHDFWEVDLEQMIRAWGLYQYPMPPDYGGILNLSYPGLVWIEKPAGSGPRAVVLSEAGGGRVALLDPQAGRVNLSEAEFAAAYTGRGILFWKQIPGISLPLARGGPDASVSTLQGLFKAWGFYPGPVDGVLGFLTRQAIRRFQEEWGLEVTGQMGTETYLKLAQAVSRSKHPTLQPESGAEFPHPAGKPPRENLHMSLTEKTK